MIRVAAFPIGCALALGVVLYLATRSDPGPADAPKPVAEAPAKAPKLYCQFYVFTEQRPRLALYFDVSNGGPKPFFRQIYLAEDNGTRTDYDGKDEPRPEWRYDPSAEPKTIASTIMVPDASQAGQHQEEIVIQLYGYEPARNSEAFFEASLKNIFFQNLPGKCRQSLG